MENLTNSFLGFVVGFLSAGKPPQNLQSLSCMLKSRRVSESFENCINKGFQSLHGTGFTVALLVAENRYGGRIYFQQPVRE